MSRLQEVPSVPRVYKGDSENTVYFAMELLTGEDMSKLRNRIRDANPTKLIPINIASYFARQMLRNLQDIHKHGFVHRDVKPSNFIRVNRKSNRFYTIDFGLAKMVITSDLLYCDFLLLVVFHFFSIMMNMDKFDHRQELLNSVELPSMHLHSLIMDCINVHEMI